MFTCLQKWQLSVAETRGYAWRKRIRACCLTNAPTDSGFLTNSPVESQTACFSAFPLDGVYIALKRETAKQLSPAKWCEFLCLPLAYSLFCLHMQRNCDFSKVLPNPSEAGIMPHHCAFLRPAAWEADWLKTGSEAVLDSAKFVTWQEHEVHNSINGITPIYIIYHQVMAMFTWKMDEHILYMVINMDKWWKMMENDGFPFTL